MIQDSGIKPESARIKSFTDLLSWQESHKLTINIYNLTKDYPKSEIYALVDQMRRATSSIGANIAEAFGRQSYREKIQYYHQSLGSIDELHNFLLLSKDLGYIDAESFEMTLESIHLCRRLLKGLMNKTKSYI